jgi:hypothetical protein
MFKKLILLLCINLSLSFPVSIHYFRSKIYKTQRYLSTSTGGNDHEERYLSTSTGGNDHEERYLSTSTGGNGY